MGKSEHFHGSPLTISWLFLSNLTIIVAAFRWSKYSYWIHLLLGIVIIILTLIATIDYIKLFVPYISESVPEQQEFMYYHRLVGFILVCGMGLQIITGFLSRFIKQSAIINPHLCIWIRRVHMFSSIGITLLGKCNYLAYPWRSNKL